MVGRGVGIGGGVRGGMFATDHPTLLSYVLTLVFIAAFEWRRYLWAVPCWRWFRRTPGEFPGMVGWRGLCGGRALGRGAADMRRVLLVSAAVVWQSGLNPNGSGLCLTLVRYRAGSRRIFWSGGRRSCGASRTGHNLLLYALMPVLLLAWRRFGWRTGCCLRSVTYASLTAFRNEI